MGYKIKVDHSAMRSAASRLRGIGEDMSRTLNDTVNRMSELTRDWQGTDYSAFINHAEALKNSDGTIVRTSKMILDFSDWLYMAADTYQKAQAAAINKSMML